MAAALHKLSRRQVLAGAGAAAAGLGAGVGTRTFSRKGTCPSPWQRALARYARAEAGLEAVAHVEEDDVYDRALGRHNAALARLLRTAAPDLAAAAAKLDLILRHQVFELSFGEAALAALRRDLRRFAGLAIERRR